MAKIESEEAFFIGWFLGSIVTGILLYWMLP